MTGPKPKLDGRTRCADIDWNNPNWEDKKFGEYAYLCPDGSHKLFEYGARCIADIARTTAAVHRMRKSPSKVQAELEHLDAVLGKLSMEAATQLNETSRLHELLSRFVALVQQLDEVPDTLASDASAKDKEARRLQPLERIQQADGAFGRLSPDALVQLEEAGNSRAPSNEAVERMRRRVGSAFIRTPRMVMTTMH